MLVERGEAQVYDFSAQRGAGRDATRDRGYWRDVGTLDAFYEAHMDLISVDPVFNLYNREWPILTWHEPLPPAKFVFADEGRTGHALDSMVCAGVVVSGGEVRRSVLSPERARALLRAVEDSVLMHGVEVGRERGRPATRSSTRTSRIEPRARRSASTSRPTASASPSRDGGVVVIGKGDVVEA